MINPVGSEFGQNLYSTSKGKNKSESKTTKEETGVTLEIGNNSKKSAVYKKPVASKSEAKDIERLMRETEQASHSLRDLVERLISRQGFKAKDVIDGKAVVNVDAQAKAEAEQLLSEDGGLGVKQTSQRIVDLAKSLAGDDKSKISELRSAIKQGFEEASKIMGGLPDISQKTYDEVMKQLDEWEKGE